MNPKKILLPKIAQLVKTYEDLIFVPVRDLPLESFDTMEHFRQVPEEDHPWTSIETGHVWGEVWGNAWFRTKVEIDPGLAKEHLFVTSKIGGVEAMMYVNGEPKGIISKTNEVGARGNHHTLQIHQEGAPAGTVDLAFECYAGHPCPGTHPFDPRGVDPENPAKFRHTSGPVTLMTRRDDVKDFVFDLKALHLLAEKLPEDSFRRGKIIAGFYEMFPLVTQVPSEHPEVVWRPMLAEARKVLLPLLAAKNGDSVGFLGLTGHSHMDTAWLWTTTETIRKCARTFSNALSLMEQYPEYRFMQSSPIHAEMVREHYPSVFKGMQKRIAEGRWEPNGGMYVESDGNMPSGESFVRQFLYGQAYTQKYFDYRADSFWLPDTFGYSAAIPQILEGCGIKYFLTTKLSWNDTTTFPHETFTWRGIDGTEVLVHFNITHTPPDPKHLNRVMQSGQIRHPEASDKRYFSYGYGDGGGGPTFEEIEMTRRVGDLEGCPRTQHMSVSAFMDLLAEDQDRYPIYDGELYAELHRGVLTVIAAIKRFNRKTEVALHDLELLDVLGDGFQIEPVNPDMLESQWKTLLKNQFHDILPGSSIPEVHDMAREEMGFLLREVNTALTKRFETLVDAGDAITVQNPVSWNRTAVTVAELPVGKTLGEATNPAQTIETLQGEVKTMVTGVNLPALALHSLPVVDASPTASPFVWDGTVLETPVLRAVINERGSIDSLIDKRNGRELRGKGLPLNTLLLGEDVPKTYDNWNVDADHAEKLQPVNERESLDISEGPVQFRLRQTYKIGQRSMLRQDMIFRADSTQIDFDTEVDWRETHSILKAGFEVNVRTMNLKSEVQYGWIDRPTHSNTPYDEAKFEVCQQRWSDLSEPGYGVALLNDCKYGIGIDGSDMRLSLLKSGGHPDPRGDEGVHRFTYALLPHDGGFSAESVVRPAAELNMPCLVQAGSVPEVPSLLTVDAPNVIVDAIKRSEEGDDLIVRLYEAEGTGVKTTVSFPEPVAQVQATNMLEENQEILLEQGGELDLTFRAFEVKTLRVKK